MEGSVQYDDSSDPFGGMAFFFQGGIMGNPALFINRYHRLPDILVIGEVQSVACISFHCLSGDFLKRDDGLASFFLGFSVNIISFCSFSFFGVVSSGWVVVSSASSVR